MIYEYNETFLCEYSYWERAERKHLDLVSVQQLVGVTEEYHVKYAIIQDKQYID